MRDRKDDSLLNVFKFQHNSVDKDATLSSIIRKGDKDDSDSSEEDEQKKKLEREQTEDFLKREVFMPHLGHEISSKVFTNATTLNEDDVSRQLEYIRRKAQENRLDLKDSSSDGDGEECSSDRKSEYRVTDFVKSEWNSLARYNAKVNPSGAQRAKESIRPFPTMNGNYAR